MSQSELAARATSLAEKVNQDVIAPLYLVREVLDDVMHQIDSIQGDSSGHGENANALATQASTRIGEAISFANALSSACADWSAALAAA